MSTNNANQLALDPNQTPELASDAVESAQPASVVPAEAAAVAQEIVQAPAANADADADASEGEDMDMDFGKILEEHEQSHRSEINENELVKGRVVKITEQVVVIDVGYKSEGIVPIAEFKEGDQIIVRPGEEIDVLVKQLENIEGYV